LASSSDATRARFFLTLAVVCLASAHEAGARVLITQEKALAEAFPGASVTRKDAFLTDAQAKRVEELSGTAPSSRVVAYYVAAKDGRISGTAYFDTHVVRTLPETVMIVVDADGAVAKVEVLSFEEPPEYLPKPKWFEQFKSRKLSKDLVPGRGIPVVTGATLTSRAVAGAVRRALALHAVLEAPAP